MAEQIPINPALLAWARERTGLSRDEAMENSDGSSSTSPVG
jgi:hypothetical protein